jgi:penicillin-binding protein 1A
MALRLVRWFALACCACFALVVAIALYFGHDLPSIERVYEVKRRPQVIVLDAAGARIGTYGDLYGDSVKLRDLPPHVARAVLAIEDRRFYRHWGIDPIGLARALYVNVVSGRVRQGGSTITQQLAKIAFLAPERTYGRKVREALLAIKIERRFTKDEILAFYLNRVYFGAGTYGIDAAARRYFGKQAAQLNLYQSAMLAGMLSAPNRLSPHVSVERAEERAETVLAAMIAAGYISEAQAAAARRSKGAVIAPGDDHGRRYFSDWILDLLPQHASLGHDDLVVRTTLSQSLQELAERHLESALRRDGVAFGAEQAAMVVMAPDGAVRAVVGGADYGRSQFNRATQAKRQPGSTFKLFVLLAALESGTKPSDRVRDAPITVKGWTPRNFGNQYLGEVSVAEAIALSLNTVAVRMAESAGRGKVARVAERLGIASPLAATPSLALGTSEVSLIELTGAFAVLANRGRAAAPYGIVEIRTRKGEIVYQRRARAPARLLEEEVVNDANVVLGGVTTRGTARRANLIQPSYGKTGTSQESRDAWFVGYTSELVAGVWYGNDDGTPMRDVTGGTLPARTWGAFMADALRGRSLQRLESGESAKPGKGSSPGGRNDFGERMTPQ